MAAEWMWSLDPVLGGFRAPKPDLLPLRGLVRDDQFRLLRYATPWMGRPANGQRTPFGLENADADCYRNSTWQALMSVPAFCTWLQVYHSPTETGARRCPLQDCPGCQLYKVFEEVYPENPHSGQKHSVYQQRSILRSVDNFFSRSELGLGSAVSERSWDKIWTSQGEVFGDRCGHQDAQEYLSFMQDALSNRGTRHALGAIRNVFGVDLEVTQYCANDQNHFVFRDGLPTIREFDITIGFPEGQDAASCLRLEDLLAQKWTGARERFRCQECGTSGDGNAMTCIHHPAPEAIFVKVERFDYTRGGIKLTHDVEFPEVLELSQYLTRHEPGDNELLYRLSCILLHRGEARSGHYHSLIRGPTERWTLLNDDVATTYETLDAALGHYMEEEYWGFTPYILGYVKAEPDDGFPRPNSPVKAPGIPRTPRTPRTPAGPPLGPGKIGWLKSTISDRTIRRHKQNQKLQDKHEERLAGGERLKKELRRSENLRKFEEHRRREEVEEQRQEQERVENVFGPEARAAKMIAEERERRERERMEEWERLEREQIRMEVRKVFEEERRRLNAERLKGEGAKGKPGEVEEMSDEEPGGGNSRRGPPKHSGAIIEDVSDSESETEGPVKSHEPKSRYAEEEERAMDEFERSWLERREAEEQSMCRENRARLAFLKEKKRKYDEKRQHPVDEYSREHLEGLLAKLGADQLGELSLARLIRLREKKSEHEERIRKELEVEKRNRKGKGKAPDGFDLIVTSTSPTSSGFTTPLSLYGTALPPKSTSLSSPPLDESSLVSLDAHISFHHPAPSPEIVSPRSPIYPNPRLNRHFSKRILAGPKRPRGTYTPQMNKVKRVYKPVQLMGRPRARF